MAPVFCPRAEEGHQVFRHTHAVNQSIKYLSDYKGRKFSVCFGLRCQVATHIFGFMGYKQGKSFGTFRERKRRDLISIFTPIILLFDNFPPLILNPHI